MFEVIAERLGKKCISINSLQGPGSIYKHGEMLFKISDLTDYRYKLFTGGKGAPERAVFTRGESRYTNASLEPRATKNEINIQ